MTGSPVVFRNADAEPAPGIWACSKTNNFLV